MLPDLSEHESKLKELLYNCLEQIQATKAALYLTSGDEPLTLVTEYGFRDNVRQTIKTGDEIIDVLLLRRAPFFVNSLGEDTRFAELLDRSATTRMLVAPIYSKGRLYGLIDMRDKAGKKEFDFDDSDAATDIARQYLEFFAEIGIFGLKGQTVSRPVDELPELVRTGEPSDRFRSSDRIVEQSRALIDRGGLRSRSSSRALTDDQVKDGATILPGVLSIPGIVLCAFSSFSELGGYQVIAGRAAISGDAMEAFQARIVGWLQKKGEPDKVTESSTQYPFGQLGTPITPDRLATTLSAPIRVEGFAGLVLTVAFEVQPSSEQKQLLEEFLERLERIVRNSIGAADLRTTRQKIAQKLLEPDLAHYPHLKNHSERVADLAERLARFVGLDRDEVDNVRLAAYVHDVGMRTLEYGSLYRKGTLTSTETEYIRQHPMVGAALVADSPLGPEIANFVLRHHERPDGNGYPSGLTSDEIPLGAKIIHICESFDAMVAQDSYQSPVPIESAVAKIRRAGGTQFDQALAERFEQMMSGKS
jgi:putative nucleotidyltransferase with HDIG domain